MKAKKGKIQLVAFLRGINVGGHHKVPMAELRVEMEKLNFENVVTLLNSGNIIFDSIPDDLEKIEKTISKRLEKTFGFPVPTIVIKSKMIHGLLDDHPFRDVVLTKDIRLYVSLIRKSINPDLQLPWATDNASYQIIGQFDNAVLSVLDLAVTKTTKGMDLLEKRYGKDITTRNWNTIVRIKDKL